VEQAVHRLLVHILVPRVVQLHLEAEAEHGDTELLLPMMMLARIRPPLASAMFTRTPCVRVFPLLRLNAAYHNTIISFRAFLVQPLDRCLAESNKSLTLATMPLKASACCLRRALTRVIIIFSDGAKNKFQNMLDQWCTTIIYKNGMLRLPRRGSAVDLRVSIPSLAPASLSESAEHTKLHHSTGMID
jgi:hypothetical protein